MSKRRGRRRRRRRKKNPLGMALGHRQGFVISTRDHEVHRDRKKEAARKACRGRVDREAA